MAANGSALPCPYGCSSSGALNAIRKPSHNKPELKISGPLSVASAIKA